MMFELLRLLLIISRPGSLVITILMYSLGTGIADFLGTPINLLSYWIGLACSLLLVMSSHLLDVFFRSFDENKNLEIPDFLKPENNTRAIDTYRRLILQFAITTLTIGAVLTVLLLAQGLISITTLLILGISFILSFAYAVPPFNLSRKGLGEILESILIVNFISALGFLLQFGEIHRLLIMLTIPLTFLLISMRLALELPRYGEDLQKNDVNMMTNLGWERGMLIHNLLIIASFALISIAFIFGLPWRLVLPVLLNLPIGLYQILQMRQISLGVKPNWGILRLTSITLFGLSAYLVTLSLWIG
jgi:1,4-dihydroxy-2-naphthoate octaprenyltransferase